MNSTSAPEDHLVESLIRLFAEDLKGIAFPEIDGESLTQLAANAGERQLMVERATAALTDAKAECAFAEEELRQRAGRALAYLKVYAGDDEALLKKLNDLTPPAMRRKKSKKADSSQQRSDRPAQAKGRRATSEPSAVPIAAVPSPEIAMTG